MPTPTYRIKWPNTLIFRSMKSWKWILSEGYVFQIWWTKWFEPMNRTSFSRWIRIQNWFKNIFWLFFWKCVFFFLCKISKNSSLLFLSIADLGLLGVRVGQCKRSAFLTSPGTNELPIRPKNLRIRPRKYFFMPRLIFVLPGFKIPITS